MKTLHRIFIVFSIAAGCASAQQAARASGIGLKMIPENVGTPSADVTTDSAFAARRAAALDQEAAPKPQPSKPGGYSLLAMSTAIQHGADFIVLPKDSVLWCPPELESKIVKQPSGKFTEWQVFMNANRNWLTTFAVSEDQVTGKKPIAPETLERFKKNASVVIATLHGAPVTVLRKSP